MTSLNQIDSIDRCHITRLLVRGFHFAHIPGPLMRLTTYSFPVPGSSRKRHDCYRGLFLCPEQERFFGDPGTMVIFFDGEVHEVQLTAQSTLGADTIGFHCQTINKEEA